LNSIGTEEDRKNYTSVLKSFFTKHKADLSMESSKRLAENRILRILDSKEKGDKLILSDSSFPSILDHMASESLKRHEQVCSALSQMGIEYTQDNLLVRGLDYYLHTTFEFVVTDTEQLGAQQATVLAGGRYDNLVSTLGSSAAIPAIGWAAGVDRLVSLIDPPSSVGKGSLGIVTFREHCDEDRTADELDRNALKFASRLRKEGFEVLFQFKGKGKNQMRNLSEKVERLILFGLQGNSSTLILKDLKTKQQTEAGPEEILRILCQMKD
jgi:histidyl-tRNA synthetase